MIIWPPIWLINFFSTVRLDQRFHKVSLDRVADLSKLLYKSLPGRLNVLACCCWTGLGMPEPEAGLSRLEEPPKFRLPDLGWFSNNLELDSVSLK